MTRGEMLSRRHIVYPVIDLFRPNEPLYLVWETWGRNGTRNDGPKETRDPPLGDLVGIARSEKEARALAE